MAPKRKPPVEEPPTAASSDEEEEASSGSEGEEEREEADNVSEDESSGSSGEETEEEQVQEKVTQPPAKLAKTAIVSTRQDPENSETESEDESETGSDSEQPSYTVKPIASKPMEIGKQRPKPPTSPPQSRQTPAKRSGEGEPDLKELKRSKNKGTEQANGSDRFEDAAKTVLFQRVWSLADEINVLEGLIRFKEEKGTDPTKNMELFFDYVKKNLNFDVSLTQLKDKVARLKKKYQKYKGKKNLSVHDRKAYELWERMWGDAVKNTAVNTNGKASGSKVKIQALKRDFAMDVKEEDGGDEMAVDDKSSAFKKMTKTGELNVLDITKMEEYVMKRGLDFVGAEERDKMEENWKKLHFEALRLFVKKNELLGKQAKMMLAAYEAEMS